MALKHELMHAFCYRLNRLGLHVLDEMDIDHLGRPFYNNDAYQSPDSNFGFTYKNIEPYLNKINNTAESTYKYFSATEVAKWKLKPELWQALDKMREIAGTTFVITSGLRTPDENTAAGGVSNSAHLRGLAADISCTDNLKRTLILRGALNCGIPVFLEDAKKHIHIDIDASIHALGQTIVSDDD